VHLSVFYQTVVLVTEYHVDWWQTLLWRLTSAVVNFRLHKFIAKVNK